MPMEKQNKLVDLSVSFAVEILNKASLHAPKVRFMARSAASYADRRASSKQAAPFQMKQLPSSLHYVVASRFIPGGCKKSFSHEKAPAVFWGINSVFMWCRREGKTNKKTASVRGASTGWKTCVCRPISRPFYNCLFGFPVADIALTPWYRNTLKKQSQK